MRIKSTKTTAELVVEKAGKYAIIHIDGANGLSPWVYLTPLRKKKLIEELKK